MSGPTRSRCSTPAASSSSKFGSTGSGDGELLRPAGLAVEKSGNVIVVDSGNNRLQVFTPDGKFVAQMRRARQGARASSTSRGASPSTRTATSGSPTGTTTASRSCPPQGKSLMSIGSFGEITKPEGSYAVTIFGPYIAADSEKAGHPRTDQFNHPTDVAIDSDGDIYVCDWGNHRVCVFDSGRRPDHHADRRCAGAVEVGPAEHRRQPRHDEGAAPGEEPRAAMAVLLPDRGRVRCRQTTRSSSPTASATGCRCTRRFATTPTSRRTCRRFSAGHCFAGAHRDTCRLFLLSYSGGREGRFSFRLQGSWSASATPITATWRCSPNRSASPSPRIRPAGDEAAGAANVILLQDVGDRS